MGIRGFYGGSGRVSDIDYVTLKLGLTCISWNGKDCPHVRAPFPAFDFEYTNCS
jgi:hypothetical protein